MNGMALPSWLLTPGTVLLRRHVRNKGLPLLRSSGACGRGSHLFGCAFTDGRESTVSTSDLSPCPPHDECEDPPTLPSQKLTVWASATWEEAADEADGMRGEEVENDQDSVPGHCQ